MTDRVKGCQVFPWQAAGVVVLLSEEVNAPAKLVELYYLIGLCQSGHRHIIGQKKINK